MSNMTMARLRSFFGVEQTHSIHHNRTDAFIRYHIDGREMIPLVGLEQELDPKEPLRIEAENILRNQYAEHMGLFELAHNREKYGTFFDFMQNDSWDFILLDNFMDVAAKLVFDRFADPDRQRPIFLNSFFYKNEAEIADRFSHLDFLTPEESAENWIRIYRWLRETQPRARIFFLPYHTCSSTSHPDRFRRIGEFYPILADLARNEELEIIPPLEVREELTKGQEDWPHFTDQVYLALAGSIYLRLEDHGPGARR